MNEREREKRKYKMPQTHNCSFQQHDKLYITTLNYVIPLYDLFYFMEISIKHREKAELTAQILINVRVHLVLPASVLMEMRQENERNWDDRFSI